MIFCGCGGRLFAPEGVEFDLGLERVSDSGMNGKFHRVNRYGLVAHSMRKVMYPLWIISAVGR